MKVTLRKVLLTLFVLVGCLKAQSQYISTYAGTGLVGFSGDGGPATNAQLYAPSDVALDPSGNLYIADFYNNVVRKVDTFGIITTIAGTGFGAGSAGAGGFSGDGGPATAARLNGPYALVVDAAGNILVADGYNHNVRKISPAGIITNFAGNHTAAYSGDGGPATAAALNNPVGLAIDKLGNVYIADDHNYVVRKVTPAGIISTFAGCDTAGFSGDGGAATAAKLQNPIGVATDTSGNVFIADDVNNGIRVVNAAGIINSYVGGADTTRGYSGDGGPASAAKMNTPRHITCDRAGNLYISDLLNNVLRMVQPTGSHTITTLAGDGTVGYSGDGGPATAAEFQSVNGVAVSGSGIIYLADPGNGAIRRIGPMDRTGIANVVDRAVSTLNVSPNPAKGGHFVVNYASVCNSDASFTVTNLAGQVLLKLPIQANKNVPFQLNAPEGVYLITVTDVSSKYSTRLVITK